MANKKILIVEDDPSFQDIIKKVLSSAGFEVQAVSDGKLALEVLKKETLDLVISDVKMPNMNGIELLNEIKKSFKTPFILMTGFSEIKETIEAYEHGADGFLAKPFKKIELMEAVEEVFSKKDSSDIINQIKGTPTNGAAPQAATQTLAEPIGDYCPVGIDQFVSGQKIQYDIYLKLTKDKFVKIAHCGENISIDRIKIYQGKGVENLYLMKADFNKYVQFAVQLTSLATNSTTLTTEKKVRLIEHVTEIIMDQYSFEGISTESLKNAVDIIESSLSVMTEDKDAKELLEAISSHSKILFSHSTGVSFYAVMIAKKLGWSSESTIMKVSMGGFFHDLGKKEINQAILDKPRMHYTPEEVKIYEQHPQRGVEILSKVQSVSAEVLQIVQQHHEFSNGYGFPGRLESADIFPLAKVVGLANTFCDLVIKSPSCAGFSPKDAITRINTISKDKFDAEYIQALTSLFDFK